MPRLTVDTGHMWRSEFICFVDFAYYISLFLYAVMCDTFINAVFYMVYLFAVKEMNLA